MGRIANSSWETTSDKPDTSCKGEFPQKALGAKFLSFEGQQMDFAGTETTESRKEVRGNLRVKVRE